MDRLLDSDLDLVVKSGFLYLPLLFDPAVERELASARGEETEEGDTGSPTDTVLEIGGRHYLRTLRLSSLVQGYRELHQSSEERHRRASLERLGILPDLEVDGKLPVILFQILPRFVRTRKTPSGRAPTREEILAFLRSRVTVPASYVDETARFADVEPLRRLLRSFEAGGAEAMIPPGDGPLRPRDLRVWLFEAVEREMLRAEKDRLEEGLAQRERFRDLSREDLATILYLADHGSLEIDGFGFLRDGEGDDYLVYKRTGDYALRDYYGRLYLFPDCRVAVSTTGRLHPVVLDRYKHPFLFGHEARQDICLRHFLAPKGFSAGNVISVLEEGLTTLLYGYNPRLRNGYHSLDPMTQIRRSLDFTDYRIPSDHPDIVSGKVEVTNGRT